MSPWQETSDVRVVFASDDEKPMRMRATLSVQPARLRIRDAARPWQTLEFRRYDGKPFLLHFHLLLATSLGRPFPIAVESIRTTILRPGRMRLSIDPPSPMDFTLHIYGSEAFVRKLAATFESPVVENCP